MIRKLPNWSTYCPNTTAANAMAFDLGDIIIFYSYETVVAFLNSSGLTVQENNWGATTGKHLNAIDNGNKKDRIPSAEFETALLEALNAPEITV